MKSALFGATGLIGSHLLKLLLQDKGCSEIHSFTRRALPEQPKLRQHAADLMDPETNHFPAVDAAFCCLGTTLKQAGSREAFRKVDFDLVLAAARSARRAGCPRFLLVTAQGADRRSRIFYNRVKGEIEEALKALDFPCLVILRPGLLLGDRTDSRPLERLAQIILGALRPILRGPLSGARPIAAEEVALAMHAAALREWKGCIILEARELESMGNFPTA